MKTLRSSILKKEYRPAHACLVSIKEKFKSVPTAVRNELVVIDDYLYLMLPLVDLHELLRPVYKIVSSVKPDFLYNFQVRKSSQFQMNQYQANRCRIIPCLFWVL